MTVKEVFDLRRQGRVEEAYEAIRPMYAVHKGKYTTLCMFWTASDILKKRLQEGRVEEASKIFEALLRVAPGIEDGDGSANHAILRHALRLKGVQPTFSMLDFLKRYGIDHLTDAEWSLRLDKMSQPHRRLSVAQRLMGCCLGELQQQPDVDHALMAMPLLQEAMRRNPRDKHTRRYLAMAYHIAGEDDKAVAIYRELLARQHDGDLQAELEALTGVRVL